MSAEVKKKTNASVTFIAISADTKNQNGNTNGDINGNRLENQAENINGNTDGEGGNTAEDVDESKYSSIENNKK